MLDKVIIDNKEFYVRGNPNGFGYEIIEKELLKNNQYYRRLFFHTYEKDKAKKLFLQLKTDQKIPDDLPDTSNETPPLKIVVHKSKHYTGYYKASTKDEYLKVIRKILIDEYGYNDYYKSYKPSEPENNSGIASEEELDTIPINLFEIRQQTKEKWDKYMKEYNRYLIELDDWKNLVNIIETGKGNYQDVISGYLSDMIELEDVEIVDNE